MQFVINIPDNLCPALTNLSHATDKPTEQYIEDFMTEAIRQRLYHLRMNPGVASPAACGFQLQFLRGDRPALAPNLFPQAEPPKRRCPDCLAISDGRQAPAPDNNRVAA